MLLREVVTLVTLWVMLIGSCTGNNYCVYSKQGSVKLSQHDHVSGDEGDTTAGVENLLDSNTTILCPKDSPFCYTLWQADTSSNASTPNTTILTQGCWDSSGESDCHPDSCVSKKRPSKAMNNTKFCCCLGNMCNANVSDGYALSGEDIADSQPALQFVEQASHQTEVVVIVLATVCSFVIVAIASILVFRLFSSGRKPSMDSMHMMEAPPPPAPKFDLDNLKLQEVVGRGRFGQVLKGTLNDQTVAVKIFISQHRQYFLNERDVYELPHMEHPSLPKYIGAEERTSADGRLEYLLVLSYAPLGCMQDFLRHNTVDWPTLCKMAQTITQGLAHLHTEFKKGDKHRLGVAHRDLNSRNILVKSDGSCELCDFGFAIRISGSKYYVNGEEQVAETTSLADVGTLRYMAPEVLEGAVNLRDCESSLKQIDIYALGLVLWEIGTRCIDLYQGVDVPDYRLPFEAEIGLHPSMEQMQVLVTRNKARPLFSPDVWKASNPAVRTYKETIEDCWDQDAEARLTALCVEERLVELPALWERHKAGNSVPGVSPTVNLTSSHPRPANLGNLMNTNVHQIQKLMSFDSSDKNDYHRSDNDQTTSSVSENTAETLLPTSPSDTTGTPTTFLCKNQNYGPSNRYNMPLQPYQGRNPCMERNLMEPDQEMSIRGNTLLGKGAGNKNLDFQFLLTDEGFDNLHFPESIESNILVTNDALNHVPRTCNPIPYVQNPVHMAGAMPKQPNLPGNGRHAPSSENRSEKKRPFSFFDRKRSGKEGGFRLGLRNLLDRKKGSKGPTVVAEDQQPLQSSPVSDKAINSPLQEGTVYCHTSDSVQPKLYNPDWYQKLSPIVTQVCMVGGDRNNVSQQTVVKPMFSDPGLYGLDDFCYKDNGCRDINDNCNGSLPPGNKYVRPDTLPVRSPTEPAEAIACTARVPKNPSEKIVKRVKTPFEVKKGRFSLCDDRVMFEAGVSQSTSRQPQPRDTSNACFPPGSSSAKTSLSLPMNINTLCNSDSEQRFATYGPTQI